MADESLENQFLDTPGPAAGLRARVVRGGFWVFALRITSRLFGLVRTIILARLLAPADFGLFGIALLAMSALATFSQTGFGAALIQKKGDTKSYLDTAWTVQVIRGILLGLVAFAIAPYVAVFFDAPAAKPILQVIALSVLLGGFSNIGVMYFRKELQFHKSFVLNFSGTLADICVAISAAFILRSVWALVFGLLAGNIVRTVLSYFIHPYRPRLAFNRKQFKELFGFGRWIFGISIITFLFNQGDDAFLGKVLGVTALGYYQLAYRIGQLPTTEYAKVISRVMFPAYAKLQDNVSKLKEAFLKTLNLTVIFMVPLTGGIFMLAPEFTRIFLTEKWMPIIPALRILVIAGVIRALLNTGGTLYLARGMPNINFKVSLLRLSTMAIVIYPLTLFFGMSGVALAVTLGNLACVPIWLMETATISKAAFEEYVKEVLPSLIATIVMCIVIFGLKSAMEIDLLSFIILVVLATIAYLISMFMLGNICNSNVFHSVSFLIASSRGIKK